MRYRALHAAVLTIALATVSSATVASADYDGAVELNAATPFGTVALVANAVRSDQIPRFNRYRIINDGDTVELEGQNGFCFIATHFDPSRAGETLTYWFETSSEVDGGPAVIDPGRPRQVPVTDNNASYKFPSYCFYKRAAGTKLNFRLHIEIDGEVIIKSFNAVFA